MSLFNSVKSNNADDCYCNLRTRDDDCYCNLRANEKDDNLNSPNCYCQSRTDERSKLDSPNCYCQNRTEVIYKNDSVKFTPDKNAHYASDIKEKIKEVYEENSNDCCKEEEHNCCCKEENSNDCCCKEEEHTCCEEKDNECCCEKENHCDGEPISVSLSDSVATAILSSLIRIEEKLDNLLNK